MLRFLDKRFRVSDNIIDTLIQKHCSKCKLCKGKRTTTRNGQLFKCECLGHYNKEYIYYAANIPKEFHTLSKESIDSNWLEHNKDSMDRIARYSKKIDMAIDKNFSLYLTGSAGSGKSFIAFLLLKQIIESGKTGYFILLRELVRAALDSLRNGDLAEDIENLVMNTDLLVLDNVDEMTAAKNNELVNTVIVALLRKRSYNGKPVILTSNCRKDELSKFIGDNFTEILIARASEIPLVGDLKSHVLTKLEDDFFGA